MNIFLSIDPGKDKSGFAVMDETGHVIEKRVILTKDSINAINSCFNKYKIVKLLIGNSKKGKDMQKEIFSSGIKKEVILVDETNSTLEARKLYWKENKPKGFLRFIPESLRLPSESYDDFAAVVIGLRFINLWSRQKNSLQLADHYL